MRAPGKLVLQLFNYRARRVEVNGRVVESETREVTGHMVVSLWGQILRVFHHPHLE